MANSRPPIVTPPFIDRDIYFSHIVPNIPFVCIDTLPIQVGEDGNIRLLSLRRGDHPAKGTDYPVGKGFGMMTTLENGARWAVFKELGGTDSEIVRPFGLYNVLYSENQLTGKKGDRGKGLHNLNLAFLVEIPRDIKIVLDEDSQGFRWHTAESIKTARVSPYLRTLIDDSQVFLPNSDWREPREFVIRDPLDYRGFDFTPFIEE